MWLMMFSVSLMFHFASYYDVPFFYVWCLVFSVWWCAAIPCDEFPPFPDCCGRRVWLLVNNDFEIPNVFWERDEGLFWSGIKLMSLCLGVRANKLWGETSYIHCTRPFCPVSGREAPFCLCSTECYSFLIHLWKIREIISIKSHKNFAHEPKLFGTHLFISWDGYAWKARNSNG